MSAGKPIYRLDDIEIDPLRGSLTRGGRELYLRQQAFQVLLYLLDERKRLVTREELIRGIWRDTAVTDKALTQCVADICNVLGDDTRHPRFIRTFPSIGYRFIGKVEERLVSGPQAKGISIYPGPRKTESPMVDCRPFGASSEFLAYVPGRTVDSKISKVSKLSSFLQFVRANKKIITIGALVFLLAITPFVVWSIARSHGRRSGVTIAALPGKKPIIVMFFENRSGGAELNWLREGLPEYLIDSLSQSDQLNVLARLQLYPLFGESGHKPGDKVTVSESLAIARQSKAQAAVLGEFTKDGNQIRIEAGLYDPSSGRPLGQKHEVLVHNTNEISTQVDLLASKLAYDLGVDMIGAIDRNMPVGAMTNNPDAWRFYMLGQRKVKAGENERAIELLQRAVQLDPGFAMAYAWIGNAYAVNGVQPDLGRQYLDKALELRDRLLPEDRLSVTAWAAIAHKDYSGAIKIFRQIIGEYPTHVEAYERLGLLLLGEEQPNEAIKIFKQGLSVSQDADRLYGDLGTAYLLTSQFNDALEANQRYVAQVPNEANARDSLGRSLQLVGRYDEAAYQYNQALQLDPEFEKASLHLGDLYFNQGQYSKAITQYQSYLNLAHSDLARAIGYGRIASVYEAKGDLDRAQEAAENEIKYQNGEVWNSIVIALAKGDKARATEMQKTLFESMPYPQPGAKKDQRSYYYYRGYFALKGGQRNEAINNFKEALRHQSSISAIDSYEDCLATAYLELGQHDEAINEFKRILRYFPNYPLAHFYLAQALDRKGDNAGALAEYQAFLQVWKNADPDIQQVVIAKQRVDGQ